MSQIAFENRASTQGFTVKLWRGERMCLIGFDVTTPEPDFVGFAIECKQPGDHDFHPLLNRLAFSYPNVRLDGRDRQAQVLVAPESVSEVSLVHFPFEPRAGKYTYRATKMHMPADAPPVKGVSVTLDISLDPSRYDGFLDVGFNPRLRVVAGVSRQVSAGTDFNVVGPQIIPSPAATGLTFHKTRAPGRSLPVDGLRGSRISCSACSTKR
jgi:hypothetical protein